MNPLSKELDGLEAVDMDYDFSVAGEGEIGKRTKLKSVDETGDKKDRTPAVLAAERLNMVITGGDEDSVSTMGNPLSPAHLKAYKSSLLPVGSGSSVTSSSSTINTRMSAMESQMQRMENSMNNVFEKMQESQSMKTTSEPPGGASAGGGND